MKYILLGLIQGLTEFLPISSQGHLLIFQRLLSIPENIAFDTIVHLGTALAALIYFRKEIMQMLDTRLLDPRYKNPNRKLLWLIIVATFFTGAIGLSFKDFFESLFQSFKYVGPFFMVTGIVILLGEWRGKGNRSEQKANVFDAIIIGLAQGAAIIPSLSRSAMTISTSLALGLERNFAARFSFLISIPAILGAGLIQSKAIIKTGTIGIGFWPLLLGFLSAFISGMIAIYFLMNLIRKTSLRGFAYYCFVVGLLTTFLL